MNYLLVDWSNVMYRSHFAHADLRSRISTKPSGLIYGVAQFAAHLSRNYSKHKVIFCAEGRAREGEGKGWRFKYKSFYKSNRVKSPDDTTWQDMLSQIPSAFALIQALGFPMVQVDAVEADDNIGILSYQLGRSIGEPGRKQIFSSDKDFYQLLRYDDVDIIDPSSWQLITPKLVAELYSVSVRRWASYRSIVGDPSDRIPGIKGFGPKRAPLLLRQGYTPFHRYEDQPAAIREALSREQFEIGKVSYRLSKLPRTTDYSYFPKAQRKRLKHAYNKLNTELQKPRRQIDDVKVRSILAGFDITFPELIAGLFPSPLRQTRLV